MSKKDSGLPLDGRWHCSPKRQFEETIVFVHHYGGSRTSVKKHQEFVADLGFDSVAFSLSFPYRPVWLKHTPLANTFWNIRTRWKTQIGQILDLIPRRKIIYSFSFPSVPALQAMTDRNPKDFKAWICDGGPFLMPVQCWWNYYSHIEPTRQLWLRATRVALGLTTTSVWSIKQEIFSSLAQLPEDFPVLSIRSWQDQLVPIAAIDEAFSGPHKLKLESLTLPEADHLLGLQHYPEEYKPRVAQFLNRYATRLEKAEANL